MRHLLVSALAATLLAAAVSPVYADSHDRGGRHYSDYRGRDRGYDRNVRRGDYRDYRRADNRSNHRYQGDRRYDRYDGRHYRDNYRYDRRYDRGFDSRRYRHTRDYYPGRRYDYSRRYYGGAYYRPYGYRHYSWHRGDRLPYSYYSSRYIIRDYGSYRLYAPPRGYHWVRVNNDVVLAAIASGIVVSVVNDLFY